MDIALNNGNKFACRALPVEYGMRDFRSGFPPGLACVFDNDVEEVRLSELFAIAGERFDLGITVAVGMWSPVDAAIFRKIGFARAMRKVKIRKGPLFMVHESDQIEAVDFGRLFQRFHD